MRAASNAPSVVRTKVEKRLMAPAIAPATTGGADLPPPLPKRATGVCPRPNPQTGRGHGASGRGGEAGPAANDPARSMRM